MAGASPLEEVREFVTSEIGSDVGDDTDIFEAGLVTSLFAMELVTHIEDTYGIIVESDDLELENFSSIRRVASFIIAKVDRGEPAR